MIVYLHGFNSTGPDSGKFAELTKGLPDIEVFAPTYPSNDPDKAIQIVSDFVESNCNNYDELMFVGTSMGGYFAQYLGRKYDAKVVLINPALVPSFTLKNYLGENTNFYTGEKYTLTMDNIKAIEAYNVRPNFEHAYGTLLLLDRADEIINYKVAYGVYRDIAECHVYDGGNHRFDHMNEALPLIERFYNSVWA